MPSAPRSGARVGRLLTPPGSFTVVAEGHLQFLQPLIMRPREDWVLPPAILASFLTRNSGSRVRGAAPKYIPSVPRCGACVIWLLMPRSVMLEGPGDTYHFPEP